MVDLLRTRIKINRVKNRDTIDRVEDFRTRERHDRDRLERSQRSDVDAKNERKDDRGGEK